MMMMTIVMMMMIYILTMTNPSPFHGTPLVKETCDSADGTKHPSLCDSDPKQEICDQQEKESFCSNQLAPHPLSPSKSLPPPPQSLPGSIGRDSRCHCGSISPHPSLSSSNFQTLWNFIRHTGTKSKCSKNRVPESAQFFNPGVLELDKGLDPLKHCSPCLSSV